MAFLTVSGEPGCRVEEVARLSAQRLRFELVTESRLREMIANEFGSEVSIPDKAWAALVTSALAHLGTDHPLVVCLPCAELLLRDIAGTLRCHLVASEQRRIGMLMLDHRLDRPSARQLERQLERQLKETRKSRFGRANV